MTLADLLRETIDLPDHEGWENERTPTPVAVRARSWFREFRKITLMCMVYNIKRFVKQ